MECRHRTGIFVARGTEVPREVVESGVPASTVEIAKRDRGGRSRGVGCVRAAGRRDADGSRPDALQAAGDGHLTQGDYCRLSTGSSATTATPSACSSCKPGVTQPTPAPNRRCCAGCGGRPVELARPSPTDGEEVQVLGASCPVEALDSGRVGGSAGMAQDAVFVAMRRRAVSRAQPDPTSARRSATACSARPSATKSRLRFSDAPDAFGAASRPM
jgi:hypothetical protein